MVIGEANSLAKSEYAQFVALLIILLSLMENPGS